MEKPWMGTTNAPSVFYGPLFLSIGPLMSPQPFTGTFICQGALSAQLLALTCPSLNSATGPHIPQRSRIHPMRAQANPLRVMNADTYRDLCDFKDQLLREDLALSLDHFGVTPPKDPAALRRLGNAVPSGSGCWCSIWLLFGCCGKLSYGPRERGLGPRSQRLPDAPAQDCRGEGGAAERASPTRLRVPADAK